ncbi:exosortase X [Pontibacter cellulosilyticus]|uniref:Archaeosortase/exosortase family protein n=1 Tax=Pontibacter cellulosilyticus TaxID=1720253 RepID=A0A923N486_9BACT|nr:archaeosortase/exosortase family protein [Pontibacter cellulosilyticus]MBC5992595.1 archaeosortase/exosortase family protein [Pontibacter cellulosilyticus]
MNSNNRSLYRFLITAVGVYICWYIFYDLWMLEDGRLDNWLTEQVAVASGYSLKIFGYEGAVKNTTVYIASHPMVFVGNGCNGLILMALFLGFVVAFPGPILRKLMYIPVGIVVINFLNVMRVVALALTALYQPDLLDFNHKYTFTFVVYACIFGLLMLWVKRFSSLADIQLESKPTADVA